MSYKILAIERLLLRHPYGISIREIIDALDNEYGIKAERKSIYSDIAILTRFMPIDIYRGDKHQNIYYLQKMGGVHTMRIIKLHAKGRLEVKNIKNDLRVIQNEVGGYIEPVSIFDDKDIIVLADEEGVLKMRKKNPFIPGLCGDLVICGVRGEEFCSIPLLKVNRLVKLFGKKEE